MDISLQTAIDNLIESKRAKLLPTRGHGNTFGVGSGG